MTERAGKVTTTKNRFNISLHTPCIMSTAHTVKEREGGEREAGERDDAVSENKI
jgi:hypothetical protein